uniref:Uncharacterized protein n=1 Tax=Astyanax mexicanus TaxID=7994 RepID=A0A8B9LM55_ASTMX
MSNKRIPHTFARNKGERSVLLIESLEPLKMSIVRAPKEETPTSSSRSRSVYGDDKSNRKSAPKDSLDIRLTALYDQSKDFLASKKDVVFQSETLGKNPEGESQEPKALQEEPCRLPRSTSYETPHTIRSAKGYSRKHDGGFYSYIGPEK